MKPHKTISDYLPNLTKTEKAILNIELLALLPGVKKGLPHKDYRDISVADLGWRGYNQALDEISQSIVNFLEG